MPAISVGEASFMTEMTVGGSELSWMITSAAFTGPVGWIAGAMVVGAIFFNEGNGGRM